MKNSGTRTWSNQGDNRVRLGVHFGTESDAISDGWATDQRFELPTNVGPGQSVTITIDVIPPLIPKSYVLRHRMVKEHVAWFDQIHKTKVHVGPHWEKITVKNRGRSYSCMDVRRGSQEDGADIITWGCHGDYNQRWTFKKANIQGRPDLVDVYEIVGTTPDNNLSNKCLDVRDGATHEGAKVQQWTYAQKMNQLWKYESMDPSHFRLRAVHSDLCLHAEEDGSLTQRKCDAREDNQYWLIPGAQGDLPEEEGDTPAGGA